MENGKCCEISYISKHENYQIREEKSFENYSNNI